jgi:hypothetical protein
MGRLEGTVIAAGFEKRNRWMGGCIEVELASTGKNIWFAGDLSFHSS